MNTDELISILKTLYEEKYSKKALGIIIENGQEKPVNKREEEFKEACIEKIDEIQSHSSGKEISELIYELFLSTQDEYFFW